MISCKPRPETATDTRFPSGMKSFGLVCLVLMGTIAGFAAEPGKLIVLKPELPQTGVNLVRDDGGWINVVVAEHSFVISFFDDQKIPVAPDIHHGLVRYTYVARAKDRTVLNRSADGMTLVSPGFVRAPLIFRVHLALFDEGPDDLAETHAFSYSQN